MVDQVDPVPLYNDRQRLSFRSSHIPTGGGQPTSCGRAALRCVPAPGMGPCARHVWVPFGVRHVPGRHTRLSVLGSVGPLRFVVLEGDTTAALIRIVLRCYACEGACRSTDPAGFVLSTANGGSGALKENEKITFSSEMLPYQFLLQGHDNSAKSVLWNSGYDIEDAKQLSFKGDIDVESVLAGYLPTSPPTFATKSYLEMSKHSGRPHPCQLKLFNFLLASCHLRTWRSSDVVARFFVALNGIMEVNEELKD